MNTLASPHFCKGGRIAHWIALFLCTQRPWVSFSLTRVFLLLSLNAGTAWNKGHMLENVNGTHLVFFIGLLLLPNIAQRIGPSNILFLFSRHTGLVIRTTQFRACFTTTRTPPWFRAAVRGASCPTGSAPPCREARLKTNMSQRLSATRRLGPWFGWIIRTRCAHTPRSRHRRRRWCRRRRRRRRNATMVSGRFWCASIFLVLGHWPLEKMTDIID